MLSFTAPAAMTDPLQWQRQKSAHNGGTLRPQTLPIGPPLNVVTITLHFNMSSGADRHATCGDAK